MPLSVLKLFIRYCGGSFHYGLPHTAFTFKFTSSCLLSASRACSVLGLHFNSPCKRLRVSFFFANMISHTQPALILHGNRTINASTQERELAPALVQFVLPPGLFTLSSTSSLFLVRATLITATPTAFLQLTRAVMPHASTSLLREQTTATTPHSNQLPVQKEVHD